ncbi:KH domain-containing protein C56G2.1 [Trichinella pseudospiralis]|uniref:KH domain-containing protein C56G2.1 n=1 Tax=Trichinella pseudospiralis TaxID=6337 RepID=A0A0V1EW85_TRIPS|nr:KH domain-containing protein C56G2.1 [Trichinella pseudospiralis]KRY77945.1 KH domain-containing protein C56G2.1 [Trichinella pseudospiralis]KRY77947.1 KH domain-containing protein C56G2.1 [Trichinella pseudospiralis]KRZ26646.1 KH domain-containing protein C56G2.1 [Trichinella pseudospiralis]KRZ41461.1 KH domain-containing protein C56G2.1 [Trichinella pseudospiralis]
MPIVFPPFSRQVCLVGSIACLTSASAAYLLYCWKKFIQRQGKFTSVDEAEVVVVDQGGGQLGNNNNPTSISECEVTVPLSCSSVEKPMSYKRGGRVNHRKASLKAASGNGSQKSSEVNVQNVPVVNGRQTRPPTDRTEIKELKKSEQNSQSENRSDYYSYSNGDSDGNSMNFTPNVFYDGTFVNGQCNGSERHFCDGNNNHESVHNKPAQSVCTELSVRVMSYSTATGPCSQGSMESFPSVSSSVEASNNVWVGSAAESGYTSVQSCHFGEKKEYNFEIPTDLVGLLIGRSGINVKRIQELSGSKIWINSHCFKDGAKICTIRGDRDAINSALRAIRKRFPSSLYPMLKLTPLLFVDSFHLPAEKFLDLELPIDVPIETTVCFIQNAVHFFVQQPTHPTYLMLSEFQANLNNAYNANECNLLIPEPVGTNMVCVASFDNVWYRVMTLGAAEMNDVGEYEIWIRILDFGGLVKSPVWNLRQIHAEFLNYPFQATEVFLPNVKPINEEIGWTQESLELVRKFTANKIVHTSSVYEPSYSGQRFVEVFLFDLETTLSALLVSNSCAEWVVPPQSTQ